MTNPGATASQRKRGGKQKRKRKQSAKQPPLPERQIRTSERSAWNRCRAHWHWAFVDRLKPIDEDPALRFGTLIHKALEARYPPGIRRGPKPAETFERLFDQQIKDAYDKWGFRDDDDEWHEAKELGVEMLENYIKEYGRDEEWKVLGSEMTFQVPVFAVCEDGRWRAPEEGEQGELMFTYVGTMDSVWENRMDGGVWIGDYKTTKGDPTKVQHLALDEQATAYWTWGVDWLVEKGHIKPKQREHLNGMMYTMLRKAKADHRQRNADGLCLNKDGSVSKQQPLPLFHREPVYRSESEREKARRRAIQQAAEIIGAESGRVAVYKQPGSGPQSHCIWCPYRDICELHETGNDWEAMRDATMTVWDPYAAHEIEEEGKER